MLRSLLNHILIKSISSNTIFSDISRQAGRRTDKNHVPNPGGDINTNKKKCKGGKCDKTVCRSCDCHQKFSHRCRFYDSTAMKEMISSMNALINEPDLTDLEEEAELIKQGRKKRTKKTQSKRKDRRCQSCSDDKCKGGNNRKFCPVWQERNPGDLSTTRKCSNCRKVGCPGHSKKSRCKH